MKFWDVIQVDFVYFETKMHTIGKTFSCEKASEYQKDLVSMQS